jgi:hypothetical protein
MTIPTTPARVLPPIDGGSLDPKRIFVIRRGGIELGGSFGQDQRPHGGVRLQRAEQVHQTGRRARRGQANEARKRRSS